MLLSEFKDKLKTVTEVTFIKPDGKNVPAHFHITEVGQINKRFIDCGGTVRNEHIISMQLWESIDFWHKLEPKKLISIIDLSIDKLNIEDHEIEIEYQADTIGKYGVAFENGNFILTTKNTTCLASDKCGIPAFEKVKDTVQSCCSPNSGCC
ncbi:MAG: hypothetical protein K1X55_10940 [Chitinophagales bacterium]|nr:hypothetical protein [Chitinophagales bacterium]